MGRRTASPGRIARRPDAGALSRRTVTFFHHGRRIGHVSFTAATGIMRSRLRTVRSCPLGGCHLATATPERLDGAPDLIEPDGLYEVVEGRVVEKSMGVYESWLASVFFEALVTYVRANTLGRVLQEAIFDLRPHIDRERRPDVAFVSYERWPRDRRIPRVRSWAVVPDLAIEIVSLTNTANEVAEKLEEYFKSGVCLVWVVYPGQAKVYAYTSTTTVSVFGRTDHLDGSAVLPELRLSLQDIFDQAGDPA